MLWRYCQSICSFCLCNEPAELLRTCWAFSVALDMATHMATGYCDVRIRLCHECTVHDFHLLRIPVHDRNTGEIIFNTFFKATDALYPLWRTKIINWIFLRWWEEDDRTILRRDDAHPTCSQAWFHWNLESCPPARLVCAVILLRNSWSVLFNFDITCSIPSSPAELHFRRTKLMPTHFCHALAQYDQSHHMIW